MKPKKPVKKIKKPQKKREFNVKGYVFGALRKIWRWHPVRRQALALAKVSGNMFKEDMFTCAKCDEVFPKKQVQVDHINPVIDPKRGFLDWNTYIDRLLNVTIHDVQILCKDCHQLKTQAESAIRRAK